MRPIILSETERTAINKMANIVTTYNPQNWYNNLPDFNEPNLTLDEMSDRLNFLIGNRIGNMVVIRFIISRSLKKKSKLLIVAKCDCGRQEFRSIKKWLVAYHKPNRHDQCAYCKKGRWLKRRTANSA